MIFTGILALAGASAQQRGPKALVVQPRVELGYLPQNSQVAHSYWVNNIGTDSLRIHKVNVSCGCTKVDPPRRAVGVNDSVEIELVFDSGTRRREQNKSATVSCNDPSMATFDVGFAAFVSEPGQQVGPILITRNERLKLTEADQGKTYTVQFVNKSGAPIQIKPVFVPTELLTIEPPTSPIAAGETGKISVKIKPQLPKKNYVKSFTFEVDDAARSRYTIPVRMSESLSSAQQNVKKGS